MAALLLLPSSSSSFLRSRKRREVSMVVLSSIYWLRLLCLSRYCDFGGEWKEEGRLRRKRRALCRCGYRRCEKKSGLRACQASFPSRKKTKLTARAAGGLRWRCRARGSRASVIRVIGRRSGGRRGHGSWTLESSAIINSPALNGTSLPYFPPLRARQHGRQQEGNSLGSRKGWQEARQSVSTLLRLGQSLQRALDGSGELDSLRVDMLETHMAA